MLQRINSALKANRLTGLRRWKMSFTRQVDEGDGVLEKTVPSGARKSVLGRVLTGPDPTPRCANPSAEAVTTAANTFGSKQERAWDTRLGACYFDE